MSVVELNRRTAKRYLYLTLFCVLFAGVYETFSHHVVSLWMVGLPAFPLLLGVLVFLGLREVLPNGLGRQLWHCGVATCMMGSLLTGIFEIAGTRMPYTVHFLLAGGALMAAGVIGLVVERK